jgi:hypothetical protein
MKKSAAKQAPKAGSDLALGELQQGVQVYAASLATGRGLITAIDDFVESQTRFDRQSRLNLRFDVVEVTEAIYLDYVSSQVVEWTKPETDALSAIVSSLRRRFAGMDLGLPSRIYLVKTTGQEEGYAAYTRGVDTVCLPANMVASLSTSASFGDPLHPGNDLAYLREILNHECFHLFSKNNVDRRYALYEAVHYYPTGNEVALPDVPWGPKGSGWTLPQLKITNPDAPLLDVYIEMDVPAKPGNTTGAKVRRALVPVLLASGPYDGGIFFEYLSWMFLAIERGADGKWVPVMSGGKPLFYESAPLLEQYKDLVGRNFNGEIFHPDEILAQNFVLAPTVPTPDLISTIQRQLAAAPRAARKRPKRA